MLNLKINTHPESTTSFMFSPWFLIHNWYISNIYSIKHLYTTASYHEQLVQAAKVDCGGAVVSRSKPSLYPTRFKLCIKSRPQPHTATHTNTQTHPMCPSRSKPSCIQSGSKPPPVSKQMFSNFCPCWDIECEQMGARKGGWEGKTRAGSNVAFQLNFSSKKSSKPQFWSWLMRQKPPIVKFSERAWEEIWWVSHSVRLEWSQFQFLETEKCFFTESWTCGLQKKTEKCTLTIWEQHEKKYDESGDGKVSVPAKTLVSMQCL